MKQNFDMTKPRYSVQILPFPFAYVEARGGDFRNFWVGMCRWDP